MYIGGEEYKLHMGQLVGGRAQRHGKIECPQRTGKVRKDTQAPSTYSQQQFIESHNLGAKTNRILEKHAADEGVLLPVRSGRRVADTLLTVFSLIKNPSTSL